MAKSDGKKNKLTSVLVTTLTQRLVTYTTKRRGYQPLC